MSGFTPLLFAYVFTAVFLAGIVRGATGFGFSMIMIVLLTLFFPPAQVAPVILFWEVLASIGHLPFVYKQVHWKSLRWLALGVALGTPFGVYCLVSIPVDAMRLIINAVVLILTSMLYCGLRPKNAPTPPQTTGVGLLAGVINGASANGGPPIILFFLSSPLGAAVGRASLIAFFLFTDVWASLFYWQQGLISLDTIIFTLVFMVPMFGGMWFGNRWFSTVDEARFRKVVLALLMIISVVGLVITVIGQCMGAKDVDQAKFYFSKLIKWSLAFSIVWNVLVLAMTPFILQFYNLANETKHLIIILVIIHNIANTVVFPLSGPLSQGLRATGDVKFTMIVSIASTVGGRLVLSIILALGLHLGVIGIALAMCGDWTIRAIIFYYRYKSNAWTKFEVI